MKKKIKHFSQLNSLEWDLKFWERKICWLTCIKMVLEYFNWNSPSFKELIDYKDEEIKYLALNSGQEKTFKYCLPNYDWLHTWLIKIVNNFSVYGFREIIDKLKSKEILVDYMDRDMLIVASVNLNFEPSNKDWWHLVLIVDIMDNWYLINDPALNEWELFVSFEKFNNCFNGNILVFGKENIEQFKANNTIFINSSDFGKWSLYLNIHEDEITAREETRTFIQNNGGILHSLHNCKERFVRFQVISPEWDKYFVRIDPNRIFEEKALMETILGRNSHLPQSCLPEAMRIGNIIKNYILWKIEFDKDEKLIIVHNNKEMSIFTYSNNNPFIHKNENIPENAFVIVSNKEDFELLKSQNINVVFDYNPEIDGSIWVYFQLLQKRCFSIETWFWDIENYQLFLKTINLI